MNAFAIALNIDGHEIKSNQIKWKKSFCVYKKNIMVTSVKCGFRNENEPLQMQDFDFLPIRNVILELIYTFCFLNK